MATEFMSGEGPDIIGSKHIPFISYARRGMFENLYDYIEKEPEFKELCYENILKATEIDGKLFQLPRNFTVNMVQKYPPYIDVLAPYLKNDYTFKMSQIVDIFNEIKPQMPETSELEYPAAWFGVNDFVQNNLGRFYDYANKYVNFGEDFINEARKFEPYNWLEVEYEMGATINPKCLFWGYGQSTSVISSLFIPEKQGTQCLALTDEDGNIIASVDLYSINSNSKNKELAWEFLKYLFTTQTNFGAMANRKIISEWSETHQNLDQETIDRVTLRTNEMMESIHIIERPDPFVYQILDAAFADYKIGVINLEQLTARLQEKLEIYVNQ
jgi:multiple sugar transport system substrate-binding protein